MEGERETADARAAAICACVRLRESSAIYTSDVCGEGERETSDTARVRSGGCEGVMEGEREKVGAREAAICVCVHVCVCVCACARKRWRQREMMWIRGRHRSVCVQVRGSNGGRVRGFGYE